jgi:hypothetical protein
LDARQTIAVRTATAKARATQAVATFTPAPPTPTIYPVGYRAPWADRMVKQADGTWMAPKEVVEQVTKHYEEFYAWLRTKDKRFVSLPDSDQFKIYDVYLAGGRLNDRINYASSSEFDNVLVDSDNYVAKVLRVYGFSADGSIALCDLEIRNSRWKIINAQTGVTDSTYQLPDRIDTDVLIYDPNDKRWKLVGSIAMVTLPVR